MGASVDTAYAIVDPDVDDLGIVHVDSLRTIIGGNVQAVNSTVTRRGRDANGP